MTHPEDNDPKYYQGSDNNGQDDKEDKRGEIGLGRKALQKNVNPDGGDIPNAYTNIAKEE
ncbi:hypothetical protein J2Z69_002977 [Paenibacillus shirakamiensis]|uniref:Uncharacterized protein n=1 Tax=Paenibacillus shirakamiensis TaxID=1265935 RepID=A0ABS4JJN4_9BACL|nr:hypothetical protein [Paenibacillus shirakamiensis]MBP2001921.1 hypothetical protein [Paenibacillus shirakamiensis]